MERLAWIGKITSFQEIPNAKAVELAIVGDAWRVVVKKGDFNVGTLVIYYRVGSILPSDLQEASFLNGKPLKTKRIMGIISQGLCSPLEWLKSKNPNYNISSLIEGQDVTELMGVIKNIVPEEKEVYSDDPSKGRWPVSGSGDLYQQLFSKTDEERIHGLKKQLRLLEGNVSITQKLDGTSFSIYSRVDPLGLYKYLSICSRNYELLERNAASKIYCEIIDNLDLDAKFPKLKRKLAIQKELIGPKINGGRCGVPGNSYYVFKIYDIEDGRYLLWDELVEVCKELGLETVPLVYYGSITEDHKSIDYLVDLANKQKYASGKPCEGIVMKSDTRSSDFHGKIISPEYEMK